MDRIDILEGYCAYFYSHYNGMHSAEYRKACRASRLLEELGYTQWPTCFEELRTDEGRYVYSRLLCARPVDLGYWERDARSLFDDCLDETFGEISIGNLKYSVNRILQSVDKIAYREMYLEWLDNEQREGNIPYFEM